MAVTTIANIIALKVRPALNELVANFWTDAELTDILTDGIKDLWGAILDVHGDHFITVDATNVSLAASGTSLTGVPADCFRVQTIEPRDLSESSASRSLVFVPRNYKDPMFAAARSLSAQDPGSADVVFYHITGVGAPAAAPTIYTAPILNSTVLLRLVYNPTAVTTTNNPIPGESDTALKAWTLAFARAKEREDRMPDPGWMAVYATEKTHLLTRLTPRQEQEPEVVEDFF